MPTSIRKLKWLKWVMLILCSTVIIIGIIRGKGALITGGAIMALIVLGDS